MDYDEESQEVSYLLGTMRSHILMELIHEKEDIQDIIFMSTAIKNACEVVIKMLTSQYDRTSFGQPIFPNIKKYAT